MTPAQDPKQCKQKDKCQTLIILEGVSQNGYQIRGCLVIDKISIYFYFRSLFGVLCWGHMISLMCKVVSPLNMSEII